ncbi:hypothetical protein KBA27_01530 [bacterium]|nr:hypothetical protein [bacterium]
MKRKLTKLFANMCCSKCGSDFKEDSFKIMREEDSMFVFRTICQNCGKSFGVAFLGISDIKVKDENDSNQTLNVIETPRPIDENEVIDAHEYIKDFDNNWKTFISKLNEED